jgi:pimeloyl-ACP methyl ester carboxylesterase
MEKKSLILIPGLLCDDTLWAHQASSLGPVADITITDRHMHHDTIGRMAEAVVARAPSHFALAGLSMGGYVALEICRRFGEKVDRLALLDTSARADTPAQTERRENLIAMCRAGEFTQAADTLYPFLVHPNRLTDACLKRQVLDMAAGSGPDIFIRQQRAIMDRIDQLPNLSTISCPTTIVCGEQDQITPPECAEEMAAAIPRSELTIVKNCGHMSTMERPERVSEILYDWFTRR